MYLKFKTYVVKSGTGSGWICFTNLAKSGSGRISQKQIRTALIIGRSYCYTVWSAIGSGLLSVCLSVCPFVCLWRCALWLSGLVYTAKTCTSVLLAYMFLFVPFDTFAVDVSFSHKMHHKKRTARATNLNPNTQLGRSSAASRHCAVRCDRRGPVPTARAERCADCEFADADPQ